MLSEFGHYRSSDCEHHERDEEINQFNAKECTSARCTRYDTTATSTVIQSEPESSTWTNEEEQNPIEHGSKNLNQVLSEVNEKEARGMLNTQLENILTVETSHTQPPISVVQDSSMDVSQTHDSAQTKEKESSQSSSILSPPPPPPSQPPSFQESSIDFSQFQLSKSTNKDSSNELIPPLQPLQSFQYSPVSGFSPYTSKSEGKLITPASEDPNSSNPSSGQHVMVGPFPTRKVFSSTDNEYDQGKIVGDEKKTKTEEMDYLKTPPRTPNMGNTGKGLNMRRHHRPMNHSYLKTPVEGMELVVPLKTPDRKKIDNTDDDPFDPENTDYYQDTVSTISELSYGLRMEQQRRLAAEFALRQKIIREGGRAPVDLDDTVVDSLSKTRTISPFNVIKSKASIGDRIEDNDGHYLGAQHVPFGADIVKSADPLMLEESPLASFDVAGTNRRDVSVHGSNDSPLSQMEQIIQLAAAAAAGEIHAAMAARTTSPTIVNASKSLTDGNNSSSSTGSHQQVTSLSSSYSDGKIRRAGPLWRHGSRRIYYIISFLTVVFATISVLSVLMFTKTNDKKYPIQTQNNTTSSDMNNDDPKTEPSFLTFDIDPFYLVIKYDSRVGDLESLQEVTTKFISDSFKNELNGFQKLALNLQPSQIPSSRLRQLGNAGNLHLRNGNKETKFNHKMYSHDYILERTSPSQSTAAENHLRHSNTINQRKIISSPIVESTFSLTKLAVSVTKNEGSKFLKSEVESLLQGLFSRSPPTPTTGIHNYAKLLKNSGTSLLEVVCIDSHEKLIGRVDIQDILEPLNDITVRQAVSEWGKDVPSASLRWGHISSWDVSQVTNTSALFDPSSTTDDIFLFTSRFSSFNEDLSRWDVSSVTDASRMFEDAANFNSDLSSWNVGLITNMSRMFKGATKFNSSIELWNVSSVNNMREMFEGATDFSQDLYFWNVSQVSDFSSMFENAVSFQNKLCWDISNEADSSNMFLNSGENAALLVDSSGDILITQTVGQQPCSYFKINSEYCTWTRIAEDCARSCGYCPTRECEDSLGTFYVWVDQDLEVQRKDCAFVATDTAKHCYKDNPKKLCLKTCNNCGT